MKSSYWSIVRGQFFSRGLGVAALVVVLLFCLVGIYAPLLASSKPLFVSYDGSWYFPLFRYLFYTGFYTKLIDIFFNLLMFTMPFFVLGLWKRWWWMVCGAVFMQAAFFFYFAVRPPQDPAANAQLNQERQEAFSELKGSPSWEFQLQYMTPYEKLNRLLTYRNQKQQNERLMRYVGKKELESTLWNVERHHIEEEMDSLNKQLKEATPASNEYQEAFFRLKQIEVKEDWYATEEPKLRYVVMPLFRSFHSEEDAGGKQSLNKDLPWWERTRINRKDLVAALIFGVRVSLVVGISGIFLALIIGVPVGALAGFYGGKIDLIVSRLLEVWESMPVFFMLLLVVAMLESKSIFLVVAVIGFFGWTGFSRYIRGEFFKQRALPYVEACRAQGFSDRYIIFSHILPNAIPPLLTLLPFAIMSAITSEAALSFLGLGEESSSSWGVLMDEGRSAFPAESYLLWPPAILLTTLLIAIALVGDTLRDALDPKLHR